MKTHELLRTAEKLLKDNAPVILTGLGISGVISTAYLAHQAGYKSAAYLYSEYDYGVPRMLTLRQKAKDVWKNYIPVAISGTLAIGAIAGAARVGNRRTAAVSAAYSLTETAFTEYRAKVTEKLGERKEQAVRDEIAADHIRRDQSFTGVIVESGKVLCYEMETGRYFNSDMETLRRAENDINAKLVGGVYATLSDFYYLVGLPYTTHSSDIGWEAEKLMKLEFSTVLAEDNRPCLAFSYNYTKPI